MAFNQQAVAGGNWRATFRHDLLASVVVFLVALPLCMGIAIASGVPVAAGLISGIVAGLVVGTLAGCPLQVSGPAAGLTVLVYDIVQRHGLEALGVVVLIAGLFQVLAGVFRLGQWFRAVSPAVILGMLAGIGVLIFASQFHVMVDDQPKGSGLKNLVAIPQAAWKGLTLPQLNSREARQSNTAALRSAGEIHRRQAHLHTRMGELVPYQGSTVGLAALPVQEMRFTSSQAASLAAEQAAIARELTVVAGRFSEFEEQYGDQARVARLRQATSTAIGATAIALDAIQSGRQAEALQTQEAAIAALDNLLRELKNHHLAALVGMVTILVILLWQGLAPGKLKIVPAPLAAVLVAATLAAVLALPVLYVEVPTNLWDEVNFPTLAALGTPWAVLIQAGLLIAVVASAETLLSATAVDQMHRGPRTKYDRELCAQGIGNMLCGMLGALPITGVIVRSSANVQAGAQTRLSAVLHGLWLLVFVVALGFLLRMIPTAALAAILVYTGYKLVNIKSVRKLKEYGWSEVGIYAATVSMIVITDLLTGVLVGVGLAAAKLLYTFSHLAARLEITSEGRRATLHLHGAAVFIRLPKLASVLEDVPPSAELHVDLEHLDYIDHACLDLLMNWAKQHESTGGKLVIDWDSLHARFRQENSPMMISRNGKQTAAFPAPAAAEEMATSAAR